MSYKTRLKSWFFVAAMSLSISINALLFYSNMEFQRHCVSMSSTINELYKTIERKDEQVNTLVHVGIFWKHMADGFADELARCKRLR